MKTQNSNRIGFVILKMPILVILFAVLGTVALAQSGHGTISGRAVDRGAAVLPGARVKLQPGDFVLATDGQGEFNINGLAPGDYTLTISYVGFKTFTQQVKVVAGQ